MAFAVSLAKSPEGTSVSALLFCFFSRSLRFRYVVPRPHFHRVWPNGGLRDSLESLRPGLDEWSARRTARLSRLLALRDWDRNATQTSKRENSSLAIGSNLSMNEVSHNCCRSMPVITIVSPKGGVGGSHSARREVRLCGGNVPVIPYKRE